MVYQLRRADGSPDPLSKGVVVQADGAFATLPLQGFSVEPTGTWESPIDGSAYPSGWRVRIPDEDLDLRVTPVLADQELEVSFRYWEGAVDVAAWEDGSANGSGAVPDVTGRGYVELTGYAGAEAGPRSGAGGS
jgi:predicted secreted hydrolase